MTIDVVFPNVADFNVRNAGVRLDPVTERGFVAEAWSYADHSVFWSANRRVLLLPPGYDELWLADVHAALGEAVPTTIRPEFHSGLIGPDLLRDADALAALRQTVAGSTTVRLLPWGATRETYQVAAAIRGWGHDVVLDGTAEADHWASLYLDSKLSCLDLARDVPGLRVPRTFTVTDDDELRGALAAVLARSARAVVRGPYGIEGLGAAIATAVDDDRCLAAVGTDPFLRSFPLLVQEYVEHLPDVGCPAVDLYVTEAGVSTVVLSALHVDGSRLRSVDVGTASLPAPHAATAEAAGRAIGSAAAGLGFRGWLGVDFVLDRHGALYATEINARRTGAMHAIALSRRWPDDRQVHVNSRLPVRATSYAQDVRPVFHQLWADGVTAYPTSVRGLGTRRPTIGVLAAADSTAEAESIVTRIRQATRAMASAGGRA